MLDDACVTGCYDLPLARDAIAALPRAFRKMS